MLRTAMIVLALITGTAATAQVRDSVFRDYEDFDRFVDQEVMNRQFTNLILTLGGRDEYTPEQMARIDGDFQRLYPQDFQGKVIFMAEDLGGGMRREARGYYRGDRYVWFYVIMHQRDQELVIINFRLNSSIKPIIEAF